MENAATHYLLLFFTDNTAIQKLPQPFIESHRAWAARRLFKDDPVTEHLLCSQERAGVKQLVIEKKLPVLLQDPVFAQELEVFVSYCRHFFQAEPVGVGEDESFQFDFSEPEDPHAPRVSQKNVNHGAIHADKVELGDKHYHMVEKNKPKRCPHCGAEAPLQAAEFKSSAVAGGKPTVSASFMINCWNCGRPYDPFDLNAKLASKFTSLTAKESGKMTHMFEAIYSDLRLGHAQEAYRRCEEQKLRYGNSAITYELCALSYFYATDMDDIIHNSARKILIYLEDAQRHDPDSEFYGMVAGTIAWQYANVVSDYLNYERLRVPQPSRLQGAKPTPQQKAQHQQQYREAVAKYRSRMLQLIDQYWVAYQIAPFPNFLERGIHELCGHNGTPWFDLKFSSIFLPPANRDITGYVWDYYDLVSTTRHFDGRIDERPQMLLTKLYGKLRESKPAYGLPDIRLGAQTATKAVTLKKRLVRNGWRFWGIVFGAMTLGFLLGNTYTIVFSCLLIVAMGIKFNDVKDSLSNLFKHT